MEPLKVTQVFLTLTKLTLCDEGLVHLLLVRRSGRCSEVLGTVMCVIFGGILAINLYQSYRYENVLVHHAQVSKM